MTEREEKLCQNQKPATRGYVYETGKFYWKMTMERMNIKLEPIEKKVKRNAVLVAASTAFGVAAFVLALLSYLK